MEKLYTVEEVASILNVHQNTIRNWLKSGSMNGIKMGKYWRVEESQLQAFIEKAKGDNTNDK